MSDVMEKAKACRACTTMHYNCAQSVACSFDEAAGVPEEIMQKAAANFGAGMGMASICGAFTGGLIAMGLCGVNDPAAVKEFTKTIKEKHDGVLECALLLKKNKEEGGDRKAHCDGMVYECVQAVEEILRKNGKL